MGGQDRNAVEGMARCGISLEGLLEAFPKFSEEDIIAVYEEVHRTEIRPEEISIKMNCS